MTIETAPATETGVPVAWDRARALVYAAGLAAAPHPQTVPLADADGLTLAEPLRACADLPAFPTSSVDGWAVRGPGPWRVVGRVLAGAESAPLAEDGTAVEIATGAMVPAGAAAVLRT
ncbi:MAG TPA: molybdopterin molybdenumtransferase MoeA, partial [Pilimelia sp.]|nr:molybdopterin molybdenumtransferase MoeA [Pilimelia sp.]